MWKTALKLVAELLFMLFLRKYVNNIKDDFSNDLSSHLSTAKENFAALAESRAAIFKQNFNRDLQRIVNSLIGFMFVLLAAACSVLTGIFWLVASAWNSPHRDSILGATLIIPILIGVCVYLAIRHSWEKEPLLSQSIKQVENDWLIFRGLDGTTDISDEANR